MSHIPPLISDLALILITAGVTTVLFKWLKQPVVLGYIVAGFLIGPHFYLLPSVADPGNIAIWADIGIIFLLFALGIEFSFKRLLEVGGTAAIATLINMGAMIVIGYVIGQLIGWTQMESIFLGGMLSMSSTTIIIKAFNDMGLQKKKFAGIVFGMLVVEDLAAIVMMVLFSTIAVSKHFEGAALLKNVLRLIFFIIIWFVSGIYIIPILLKKFKRFLNDEMLLIVAVGLCLGMVLLANAVGFSTALGAFIMGSILAETIEAKRIEHLIEPLKNLFGAVFFVSVGMMLMPDTFVTHAWTILILTAVVLVGRVIFATAGILISGQGLKVALQGGFSLAQIGEFSFIIATLGIQLGVIDAFIYPIIVTVSIITTFTTPYFIKGADPVCAFLEKIIPPKWERLLHGTSTISAEVNRQSDWNIVWKHTLSTLSIFAVLTFAMLMLAQQYVTPFITAKIPGTWGLVLTACITLILMAPFLAGAMIPRKNIREKYVVLLTDKYFHKGLLIFLSFVRMATCITLILAALVPLFPNATITLVLLSIPILILMMMLERFGNRPEKMIARFMQNFNAKEQLEEKQNAINRQDRNVLLSKNVHIEEIEIPQNTLILGQTLSALNIKRNTGVNVICIIRGAQRINVPDGSERIFPFDRIVVAGADDDIQRFMQFIRSNKTEHEEAGFNQITLSRYPVEANSPYIGRSVKELKVRENTGCLILYIDREGQTIADFDAGLVLQQGDVLWLAGEKKSLAHFSEA
jgi:CPA2 family monovalent cation:H+ antiporter-2